MTLPFVLARTPTRHEPDIESLRSDEAQNAARFWVGKQAARRKDECIAQVGAAMRDKARLREVVGALRLEERRVLGIVERYGGAIGGPQLRRELLARGIVKPRNPAEYGKRYDPVHLLRERLLLVTPAGYYCYSFGGYDKYPDVSLPRGARGVVAPEPSLDWKASALLARAPGSTTLRAGAEMMIELQEVVTALASIGSFQVNQGGALPASIRGRIAKLAPALGGKDDPMLPPDRISLVYMLLVQLGGILVEDGFARLVPERVERLLKEAPEAQASAWVRAWLRMPLWQDGIGQVPDRDGRDEAKRIRPDALTDARELVVWALSRIARGEPELLDLETFLSDLHGAAGDDNPDFYWHAYAFRPKLAASEHKEKLPGGPERRRAYWLDDEGVWVANALLVTLVHLGVIERGSVGRSHCFRLTELGRVVFGAPEIAARKTIAGGPCLTVQPNHDVLLYLDSADGEVIATLSRIAARTSAASGAVHTFRLTRETIYGALEGGLPAAEIEAFLTGRSRVPVPENVLLSVREWSRKRETLVLRTGVGLIHDGARFVMTSSRAAASAASERGLPAGKTPGTWRVEEDGRVDPGAAPSVVALARLRRFAACARGWQITAASVKEARAHGITAVQILEWIAAHASHPVPPILRVAIERWCGARGDVALGELLVLQVDDEAVHHALASSARFAPFIVGTLAPGCLVVDARSRAETARLLEEVGLAPRATLRPSPALPTVTEPAETRQSGGLRPQRRGRARSPAGNPAKTIPLILDAGALHP